MPATTPSPPPANRWRTPLLKLIRFALVGAFFGWFYGWVSPKCFPKGEPAGFAYGMLHGAIMPMALPSLLMGQNVEIFAADNVGRWYKIGYIAGINACGLVFFGSLFWNPRKKSESPPPPA